MDSTGDRLGSVTVSLALGFICWGGVYFYASLVNMYTELSDSALIPWDAVSAFFSMFMIFIFAYGVLVIIELALTIKSSRRTLLIQQKSDIDNDKKQDDMSDFPESTLLKSWATLLILPCWVGLYCHTGILLQILKRSISAQGIFNIFIFLLLAFKMTLMLYIGISSVNIMTNVRKKVSDEKPKSEDSAPFDLDIV